MQNQYQNRSPISSTKEERRSESSCSKVVPLSGKRASSNQPKPHSAAEPRNENILCAVLALLKELGDSELELVKRDIDKKLIASK